MSLIKLLKENQGTIVDVRTWKEYIHGHSEGSVNIPLQDIPQRMEEIKSLTQPLIICCASGVRSRQATSLIGRQGIKCVDAGSWLNIEKHRKESAA